MPSYAATPEERKSTCLRHVELQKMGTDEGVVIELLSNPDGYRVVRATDYRGKTLIPGVWSCGPPERGEATFDARVRWYRDVQGYQSPGVLRYPRASPSGTPFTTRDELYVMPQVDLDALKASADDALFG